jgi:hypothetical protein
MMAHKERKEGFIMVEIAVSLHVGVWVCVCVRVVWTEYYPSGAFIS